MTNEEKMYCLLRTSMEFYRQYKCNEPAMWIYQCEGCPLLEKEKCDAHWFDHHIDELLSNDLKVDINCAVLLERMDTDCPCPEKCSDHDRHIQAEQAHMLVYDEAGELKRICQPRVVWCEITDNQLKKT